MPSEFDPEPSSAFGVHAPRGLAAWVLARTRTMPDTWLGRRLAFGMRRLAIARLNGRPLDIVALGARMRLFPYNNVCEKRILFTPQCFDAEERAFLLSRMRDGFTFVDIGANIGGYALFVAGVAGPRARILAVEPQPDIYERLVFNVRLNSFPTVKAIACAVADQDGEVRLFVADDNRGESSVKIVSSAGVAGSVTVPCKTLLTLLGEEGFSAVDAAKLDTEGAEDLILDTFFQDAPETLWPRILILERDNNRWHVDLPALLASRGYSVVATTRTNVIYERTGATTGTARSSDTPAGVTTQA